MAWPCQMCEDSVHGLIEHTRDVTAERDQAAARAEKLATALREIAEMGGGQHPTERSAGQAARHRLTEVIELARAALAEWKEADNGPR